MMLLASSIINNVFYKVRNWLGSSTLMHRTSCDANTYQILDICLHLNWFKAQKHWTQSIIWCNIEINKFLESWFFDNFSKKEYNTHYYDVTSFIDYYQCALQSQKLDLVNLQEHWTQSLLIKLTIYSYKKKKKKNTNWYLSVFSMKIFRVLIPYH